MSRHLGWTALTTVVICWGVFLALPIIGGLDPSMALGRILRMVSSLSLVLVALSAVAAVVALIRGPQRRAAALALVLGMLYGLVLTGAIFVLLDHL